MNKKYNNISLAWGAPGIGLQIYGQFMNQPLALIAGTIPKGNVKRSEK